MISSNVNILLRSPTISFLIPIAKKPATMINAHHTTGITRRREASFVARVWETMGVFALATVFSSNVSAFCSSPTNDNFHTKAFGFDNRMSSASTNVLRMASRDINDSNSKTTQIVDELLEQVEKKEENEEGLDEIKIRDLITNLSSNAEKYVLDDESTSSLFDPLVGYYNVSYTLVSRPNDNPVGGKWTRGLWTVKRTMQHVLPPLPVVPTSSNESEDSSSPNESPSVASKAVAQVLNAIRLELLWGFVGVWVLLRGDAVPLKLDPTVTKRNDEIESKDSKKKRPSRKLLPNLSDRTVKAYFDRPRIGLSLQNRKNSKTFLKRVLTLGPTSAVVLDTPYADSRIRLGKGGTSGSQFVFSRLPKTDVEAREGWKWVIEENTKSRSLTKKALVLRLGFLGLAFGFLSRVLQQRWMKVLAGAYAVISGVSIFGLVKSTGGIETEGDTYMKGNQDSIF